MDSRWIIFTIIALRMELGKRKLRPWHFSNPFATCLAIWGYPCGRRAEKEASFPHVGHVVAVSRGVSEKRAPLGGSFFQYWKGGTFRNSRKAV